MLGRHFDEIELILFESSITSLPSKKDIKQLSILSTEFDISYNVHLPTDVLLDDFELSKRRAAIKSIKQVIDLTLPLSPSTFTLHLPYTNTYNLKKWQKIIYESMEHLLSMGINSRTISIENLLYPFEWVEKIIMDLNLSVCLDLGHLILLEANLEKTFDKFSDKISIMHIHGVKNNRDHISLDNLTTKNVACVMDILKKFTGIVSIEVFSYNDLKYSLQFLDDMSLV